MMMKSRIVIVFRHLDRDAQAERFAQEHAMELMFSNIRVQSCRVVIDSPHQPQHRDAQYQVRVSASLPDRGVVIGDGVARGGGSSALVAAIAEAFASAQHAIEGGFDCGTQDSRRNHDWALSS